MSQIYLIRHGQAGTRDDYDRLSELGQEQTRRLGAWLAREGVGFDQVLSGGLRRQRETAELALGVMAAAGQPQPEPEIDPEWNEFDLDAVYASIAPRIAGEHPEYRAHFEAVERSMNDAEAALHRQWTAADSAVVLAWMEGRFACAGESWADFTLRVRAGLAKPLAEARAGRRVAVFTSATPVAISLGQLYPMDARGTLRLGAGSFNTNVTILNVKDGEPSLAAFNWVAHLEKPEWRTHR